MNKRIASPFYTRGKFGKGWRETLDRDNPYLYSKGRYPTKIRAEDLPEDYLEIMSRSIWYMTGYLKISGIVDMDYTYVGENHLFKDDYIYISYREKLRRERNSWGNEDIVNYDVCICGNDIINIVLASEIYSGFDTTKVRRKIEEKRVWLRDNEPDYYKDAVKEDEELFSLFTRKGYIPEKIGKTRLR